MTTPTDTYADNATTEPSAYLADLGVTLPAPVGDLEIDWTLGDTSDLPIPPVASVVLPPIPEDNDPDAYTAKSWDDLRIVESAARVIAAEQNVLATVGLATARKDLLFDPGQAFLQVGHDNALAERKRLDALPNLTDAILAFQATIAAEHRRDRIVDLVEYRLDSDGRIQRRDLLDQTPGAALTETSWRQLTAAQYGVGTANVNAGLSKRRSMVRRMRARDAE